MQTHRSRIERKFKRDKREIGASRGGSTSESGKRDEIDTNGRSMQERKDNANFSENFERRTRISDVKVLDFSKEHK